MGTKLQCAINLLATSPNSTSFTLKSVDDWDYFQSKVLKEKLQRTALDEIQDSMDRMLEQHNIEIESIKKTMLMHEDIFKQQVRELHRLYSLQKMLMNELKNEIKQTRFWSPMSETEINHSKLRHPTTQTCGYNLHFQSLRDDPSPREQSGSCSGDNLRMPRCFDLERPADEDILTRLLTGIEDDQAGPSTQRPPGNNIKMINDGSDEETEVELTLSIGGSSSKGISKNHQPHCSLEFGCSESSTHDEIKQLDSSSSIKSNRGEECSEPTNTLSSSSATVDQERKRPHWLFQGLSLNRT